MFNILMILAFLFMPLQGFSTVLYDGQTIWYETINGVDFRLRFESIGGYCYWEAQYFNFILSQWLLWDDGWLIHAEWRNEDLNLPHLQCYTNSLDIDSASKKIKWQIFLSDVKQ